jgi:hypothetical protein
VPTWTPRPAPTPVRLLLDDAVRGARRPLTLAAWAGGALREPGRAWAQLTGGATVLGDALVAGLRVASATPLNRPTGPHRRVDWYAADLALVKEVKRRLGGTVNDVVLAAVAGALHHFLGERGTWLAKLDYRVVIPVNMRPPGQALQAANRVSALFLSLPVAEPDPQRRFAAIQAETRRLKDSRAAEGTDLLVRFADWTDSPALTRFGVRFVSRLRPYHLIASCAYNGVGVSLGTISGVLLADLAVGRRSELVADLEALPAPAWIPGEPWLGIAVRSAIGWLRRRAGRGC